MKTEVRNGRLCTIGEDGSATPIPLGMDDARDMKNRRAERVAEAEALCPPDAGDESLGMEMD